MLHQLLGVGTRFDGHLCKLRFLLGREMYFHVSRLQNNRLRGNVPANAKVSGRLSGGPEARPARSGYNRTKAMSTRESRHQPTWTDVKRKLGPLDTKGLVSLIQDLYGLHTDNWTFLHTRFGLGAQVLRPYMEVIDRWLWPGIDEDVSVTKAKQAIANYRKAVGEPGGLAELMVFYCERASGFCSDLGYQDESYFNSLTRMFKQALIGIGRLPRGRRDALLARLDRVRELCQDVGYGVGDDVDDSFRRLAGENE
jgi:hypothetical protein